ncbi:MAG: GxxExxY protein [Conexivisphaerales archaeon]
MSDEKKFVEEFYSFFKKVTMHIYNELKAGKQETAYRDAIASELQLSGFSVQTELPITYKYTTTKNTVVTVGSGKIDVYATSKNAIVVVEVKVAVVFLFRQIASRPVLQLEGYVNTVAKEHPESLVLGSLVNFPVPQTFTPEWYFITRSPLRR